MYTVKTITINISASEIVCTYFECRTVNKLKSKMSVAQITACIFLYQQVKKMPIY